MIKGSLKDRMTFKFPDEWEIRTLSDITTDIIDNRGKTPPLDKDGKYPLLEIFNMQEGSLSLITQEKQKYVNEEVYQTWFRNGHPFHGDILISTVGNVGIVSYYDKENASIAQNIVALRLNRDKAHSKFLAYFLSSVQFEKWIKGVTMHAVQPSLKVPHLLEGPVPLPLLNEQQKIASILSSVDETIEKTKQIIEQTNDLKNGVLQKLIARGIGHKKFKDSQVGKIPLSWEVKNFDELSTKILGGGTPSRKISDYYDGKIPWVTVKDLKDKTEINQSIEYITDLGLQNSAANLIPKGNLIISTRMAVGKALKNTADVSINQDMKGIIVDKSTITTDFFLYSYISKKSNIESMGSGTTVKGIRLDSLKKIKFAIPPLEEQEQITNIIKEIENKVYTEKQTLKNLILLKQGLMQQLLTGKVRVSINEEVPQ